MSDARDAFRALRATPVASIVAILSLALGIGANTAIFSIVNALMLRALPVKEPQHLVQLLAGTQRTSWSNPLWEQVRERDAQLFDGAFAYSSPSFNIARSGEEEPVKGVIASGAFFDVLGVPAILGRTFTKADDVRRMAGSANPQSEPVMVIGYAFWQRRFGGAADVIGKSLVIDRVPFTIIGVTPPEFTGVDQGRIYDVAIPLAAQSLMRPLPKENPMDQRSWWWLRVIARLKPGQTVAQATQALRGVQPQMRDATIPPDWRAQDLARYLKEPFNARPAANGPASLAREYRQPLFIMMGVVGTVLLIACANIANLLLARASARRHELSVRLALGASSSRLARQLIAESLLLSGCGAVLGLLFAQWGSRLLVRELSNQSDGTVLHLAPDWRVLAFTTGVAIATALIFGTVPALRATRVEPNEAIKEQGRAIVGEGRLGFGSLLIVAQVALSLTLVVGAGLFVRSFSALAHVRLGFDVDPILIATVNARRSQVAPEERAALYERVRQAVLAVPGVQAAAASIITPVNGSSWDTLIENPGGLSLPESERDVYVNAVTPAWFATYGTPIIAGRDFTTHDAKMSPHVILVNETFVKKYFAGASPIGRTVREVTSPGQESPALEIIGVVKDAVYLTPRDAVPPTMYQAISQGRSNPPGADFAVRAATGSPVLLTRSLADAIMRIEPDLTLNFHPFARDIRAVTVQERVIAMLSGFFGALALLLAGLGLYGVMAYAVNRRRTEIGIRMALGSGPARAVAVVLRRVALLLGAGIVVGSTLSLWTARFVSTLLYGLAPHDPGTLAGAAVVLTAIGGLASWLPARRAARIDPARVLREG
jgi:putative ABC transport system permease protein